MKKKLLLLIILILCTVFAACGAKDEALYKEGNTLYKAKQYEQAIEKYLEAIKANENYTKAYYNLASVYMKQDPPDYVNAVANIKTAIAKAPETGISQKKLDRWISKSNKYIKLYYENVVRKEDTLEAYRTFIEENPEYPGNPDIKIKIDAKIFEGYKKTDTIEGYEEFISQHSDSKFAYDAESMIYNKLIEKNDEETFKSYLKAHPDSKFKVEIQGKLAEMEYDKIIKISDKDERLKSLEVFIKKYPDLDITKVAKDKLIDIEWKNAKGAGSAEAFISFAEKFKGTKLAKEAIKSIDKMQFRTAKEKATLASTVDDQIEIYKKFKEDFPENRYTKQVNEILKRLQKDVKTEAEPAKEKEAETDEESDSGTDMFIP